MTWLRIGVLRSRRGTLRERHRTVVGSREPDGSELRITQSIDWRLGIPHWIGLPPVRHRRCETAWPGTARAVPDRISVPQARAVSTMVLFSLVSGLLYGQLTQVVPAAARADIGDASGQQAAIFAVVRGRHGADAP